MGQCLQYLPTVKAFVSSLGGLRGCCEFMMIACNGPYLSMGQCLQYLPGTHVSVVTIHGSKPLQMQKQ